MFDNITSKKDSNTGENKNQAGNFRASPNLSGGQSSGSSLSNNSAGKPSSSPAINNIKPAKPETTPSPVSPAPPPIPNIPDSKKKEAPRKDVEDIFADTDTPARTPDIKEKPDIFKPKDAEIKPAAGGGGFSSETAPGQSRLSKFFILSVLAVGLILVIIGGILGYKILTGDRGAEKTGKQGAEADKNIPVPKQPVIEVNNTKPIKDKKEPEAETGIDKKIEEYIVPPADNADLDTDQDGLTDKEENELGTNISNKDSDGDGLYDREEVKVYKTDPLNPDTDGDGYSDGEEVKNNFNPKGAGKLYEL